MASLKENISIDVEVNLLPRKSDVNLRWKCWITWCFKRSVKLKNETYGKSRRRSNFLTALSKLECFKCYPCQRFSNIFVRSGDVNHLVQYNVSEVFFTFPIGKVLSSCKKSMSRFWWIFTFWGPRSPEKWFLKNVFLWLCTLYSVQGVWEVLTGLGKI